MSKLLGLSGSVVLLLGVIGWTVELADPAGQPAFGEWHRLNTRYSGGSPSNSEHEVMHFWVEAAGWVGHYDKHAEPTLGFPNPPDGTVGVFAGAGATKFVCEPAFPFYPCQDVVQVVEGTTRYSPPAGHHSTYTSSRSSCAPPMVGKFCGNTSSDPGTSLARGTGTSTKHWRRIHRWLTGTASIP